MQKVFPRAVLGLVFMGSIHARPQAQQPQAQQTPPAAAAATDAVSVTPTIAGGTIKGTVKAGTIPLPGVSVTATNTLTGKKYATTTDVTGAFAMAIPRNGRYVVKTELAAFAIETKEVLINAASENGGKPNQIADFTMQLASRVQQQENSNRDSKVPRRARWQERLDAVCSH